MRTYVGTVVWYLYIRILRTEYRTQLGITYGVRILAVVIRKYSTVLRLGGFFISTVRVS